MPTVLFLCSGNYYRSRFAEIYFNWLAPQRAPSVAGRVAWISTEPCQRGPDLKHAVAGLQARGIEVPDPRRHPQVVEERDFDAFELVIAVKEAEDIAPRCRSDFRPGQTASSIGRFTIWISPSRRWCWWSWKKRSCDLIDRLARQAAPAGMSAPTNP